MSQRTIRRTILSITAVAGATVQHRLDVSGKIRRLFLVMSGAFTPGASATEVPQNPGTFIPQMSLMFNHETILKQGRWLDWVDRGYVFSKLPAESTVAHGTATLQSFISRIEWPFCTPGGRNPVDTVLHVKPTDRLDINLTFGAATSITGGANAALTTPPTIRVVAEISNADPDPIALYKEAASEDSVGTDANTGYEFPLVVGPNLAYHHLIPVTEDNASGVRTKVSALNGFRLQQSGNGEISNPFGTVEGLDLQHSFNQEHGKSDSVRTGVYPVLFQPQYDGMLTFNLMTRGLNDLRFIADHDAFTTNGVFRVLQGTIEPIV
jgi:hypothetical protein